MIRHLLQWFEGIRIPIRILLFAKPTNPNYTFWNQLKNIDIIKSLPFCVYSIPRIYLFANIPLEMPANGNFSTEFAERVRSLWSSSSKVIRKAIHVLNDLLIGIHNYWY